MPIWLQIILWVFAFTVFFLVWYFVNQADRRCPRCKSSKIELDDTEFNTLYFKCQNCKWNWKKVLNV